MNCYPGEPRSAGALFSVFPNLFNYFGHEIVFIYPGQRLLLNIISANANYLTLPGLRWLFRVAGRSRGGLG